MKSRTTDRLPSDAGSRGDGAEVAEFQGLYGTYHVSELLLQKIWLRGAFDQMRARTTTGERVTILHPGTWNRLSGPDFRGARVVIGDREIVGDVEVHFHAAAWRQHGHDTDPAYADVVLHVVLFPPESSAPSPTATGADRPTIAILPLIELLWHDLEEYATDEAVAALTSQDALPLVEELLALESVARDAAIRAAAAVRWQEKVRYATVRVERCGWAEACHLTALEILGYRSNREAMLRVGAHFPLAAWNSHETVPTVDQLLAAGAPSWSKRGVRPANQPRLRLAQYLRWTSAVPDWPGRLQRLALPPVPETDTESMATLRRRLGFAALHATISRDLTGDALGGLRFDTFVTNLVLPFLAMGHPPTNAVAAAAWWRLWTPGDAAEVLLDAARRLAAPGARGVRTNETMQGLLGLHLQRMRTSAAKG